MAPIDLSMITTPTMIAELQNRGAVIVHEKYDDVVDLDIVGPCTVIIIEAVEK